MEVVKFASSLFRLSPALLHKRLFLFFGDTHLSEGNVFDITQSCRWVLSRSLCMAILTTPIQDAPHSDFYTMAPVDSGGGYGIPKILL